MSTRYFLALDGVNGDSLDAKHKGWFEVSNFDIDLTSAGGGAGTAFSPLTLTLNSNTGLAPLLALAATGEHLDGATLVGVTDGAEQAKVYQLDLADVLVTNVEHHADVIPEVGLTLILDYSKIELETFTQNVTGGVVPGGQFGFDLTANTAGITLPSVEPNGSVAASPPPLDYFMLIDGLNGGSQEAEHEGWFEITGVNLDMEKLAAGDFATLDVTLLGGVELAELMKMAVTGSDLSGRGVIKGVHIEGFRAGAAGPSQPTKVYDLTLANVAVSDVAVTHAADSETLDSLSLDYGKIALVTNGIDGSGNPIKNGEFGYDVTNNTTIAPFSLDLNVGSESSSASGDKYFLTLDNVAGDLAPAFKGPGAIGTNLGRWVEVNSFDIDLQGIGLFEPGVNKTAAFSPLTLTLDSNTALAPLLTMAATNDLTAIKAATLIGVKSDGQTVSYRLDLGTLLVTNVEDIAGGGLTVSLDFEQIKLWTFSQDNSGVISHANDFTWNVLEHSEDIGDMPSIRGGGIAASPEPATYFMLIDGLNGGSTDSQHKGWFEISSFDFDLENPSTLDPKAPPVLGKPQFSPLIVTLPQEAGLADVMDLAATGGLVKGVRIEGFTGGTTPAKVYELTLADVAATRVVDGEGGGYSLSLDYTKIALVTNNEAGAQTRQFSYDIETNSAGAFNPSSLALSPDSSGGPVTPAKYFLAIDGVKGDSLDSSHQGWFEITDFDIDLDNAFAGVPGGPGGPGKPDFSPLTLTLDSNTGLAPLLTMAATGATLNGATLVGVNAAGQQVYQLDLADVRATKVEDDAGAGLTLSLDYGKIELETFTQNGTGGLAPEGKFGFDIPSNKDGIAVPSVFPDGSVDPSPQPTTYFMLVDGLNGGSTDTQHKGWFEITGFDVDLANLRFPLAGEANFSPLTVTLPQEAGLADVMDLAATGGLVKGVRIEGFTDDTTPAEVYELTLADVQVTKVADGEGDGFTLSLDYSKIALVTNGIDATGQPTSNGAFAYDVANKIEIDPFSLDLSPSGNQAPVANALSISTDEDTATAVMLSGSDVDGDSLSFTVVSGPAHGTLSGSGANLAYTPASNYNGPDSFTYVANDGALDSAVASVSLTVNPVNDNAIVTGTTTGDVTEAGGVNNGTAGVPTASGNLASTDVDNPPDDIWQVVAAGAASIGGFGTYAVAADGSCTYTLDDSDPAVQALNGAATLTDTFNALTQDGTAQLVTITIHAQNDAAVLSADVRNLTETNAAADIFSFGVLTISDPDSAQTFVAQASTVGSFGTFVIDSAGAWTYTAGTAHNEFAAGSTHTDTFSVASADGTQTSVTINIAGSNDAPVANAQSLASDKDTAVAVMLSGSDVDSDSLAFAVLSGPAHGTLSGSGANRTYTPDPGYLGADSFSYVANDGTVDSAAATVSLNVHLNIAPVMTAFDQSATRGQVFDASTQFSATDGDGDPLLYFFWDNNPDPASGYFTVNGVVQAAHTTFAVSAAQLALTTFTAGQLPDGLFVNAWDGAAFSGPQEFHINVPANQAPTVTAPDFSASKGQVVAASSLFSANDANGDPLLYFFYDNNANAASGHFTVNGAVQAAGTTFAVTAAQLALTTFTAGTAVSDNLFVNAWDGVAFSGPQEFHVNVPANRAPTAMAPNQTASSGQVLAASSLFTANDADGDSLLYFFFDNNAAPASGHFEIAGVTQAAGTTFAVTQGQLANTTFVAGTTGDDLFVNAWDGVAFSGPKEFNVDVA